MTRVPGRLARRLACAAILSAALPLAAGAAPLDDYLAARDQTIADAVEAARAGKSEDNAVRKREAAALERLGKSMAALVGPLTLKGLGSPLYTIEVLVYGEGDPTPQLDGIAVSNDDETTYVVVSPEPVFNGWLAARAQDEGAPEGFGDLKKAVGSEYFYNNALAFPGGGYTPYVALPVTTVPGETVYAGLGLYAEEAPANLPPNQITVVRVADGKVTVGITGTKLDIGPIAACEAIFKPFQAKIDQLQKTLEKDNKPEDPAWDDLADLEDQGGAAFRDCFAKQAPSQPFFAAATKAAQDFLGTIRGQ